MPSSESLRRSISARISNVSSLEHSIPPSRSVSVSPRSDNTTPTNPALISGATLSSSEFPPSMDAQLVNTAEDPSDNVNKRYSKFSFTHSYANSDEEEPFHGLEEEPDREDNSRFGSVSTASEYPPGTSMKVRSPPPGNRPPKNGLVGEPEPAMKAKDLHFDMRPTIVDFDDTESDGTLDNAIMIPSENERGSRSSLPPVKVFRKPLPGSGTETIAVYREATPDIVVLSPKTPTFAHVKGDPKSPRAEKALLVPWIKRFSHRRGKSEETQITVPQDHVPHGQQDIKSFFDPASSDGEDENEDDSKDEGHRGRAFLGNAQQASFRRPVLVDNGKPSHSPNLGLKDILSRGPSTKSTRDVSPLSGGERNSMLDTALTSEEERKREARRIGVIGSPVSGQQLGVSQAATGAGAENYQDGDGRVSGLWTEDPDPFQTPASLPLARTSDPSSNDTGLPAKPANALRSHPTNAKKPLKRQVTFPVNMRAIEKKTWEREDVISTPYPAGYHPTHETGWGKQEKKSKERKANLTVVVYGRGNGAPKVHKLMLPTVAHEVPIKDSEKGEKTVMNRDFDDASLAMSLYAAYKKVRGSFFASCGAKTVRNIRLLGYEDNCQLATRRAMQKCLKTKDEDEDFAENKLIDLYRKPRTGRGRWVWWSWVRGLPENEASDAVCGTTGGKVALELVEGWSVKRILIALAIVALCSALATLLWVIAGDSQTSLPLSNSNLPQAADNQSVGTTNEPTGITTIPRSVTSSTTTIGGVAIAASRTSLPNALTAPGAVVTEPNIGLQSEAVSAALGVAPAGAGNAVVTPTVMQRDATSTSASPVSASDSSSGPETASSGQQNDRGTYVSNSSSRVGTGVVLGLLVLLFGGLIVGAWILASWMVM